MITSRPPSRAPPRSRASAGSRGRAGGGPRRPPARARRRGRLGPRAEPVAHVVLAAERLHHLDPDDGLVGGLGDVALALLHLARDRHHPVGEAATRGARSAAVESMAKSASRRLTSRQNDRGADDHHHALDALHHAPADEVADRVQVVGRARDHLPGRVPVVERAREVEVGRSTAARACGPRCGRRPARWRSGARS